MRLKVERRERGRWLADWRANRTSVKGRIVMTMFRSTRWLSHTPFRRLGQIAYYLMTDVIMGISLPTSCDIGAGLTIQHGQGLVVHANVHIGANCVLRQNTTIGKNKKGGGFPWIGDEVSIGANSAIIGPVRIGHGAVVGAGSVVLHDVADGELVAGNPAVPLTRALPGSFHPGVAS